MLSRVADNLYWLSRYLERAEHTARLLSVQQNLMLDQDPETSEKRWQRVLDALNQPAIPENTRDAYNFARKHLIRSIRTYLMSARDNARQIREEISSDMWEQINRLVHEILAASNRYDEADSYEFLTKVIEGTHLFQGLTDSIMTHGEGWRFMQLGRFLERASNTAVLIDAHYRDFESVPGDIVDAREYLEWVGLLRCCTAFEAYCKAFGADLNSHKVAEFLLMNPQFPHSMRYAADSLEESLDCIHDLAGSRAPQGVHKLAGRLKSTLSYTPLEELMLDFHDSLRGMEQQCRKIHASVYQVYISYPIVAALEE